MMTEDEAKTKWCPMVKTVSGVTGTNRDRYQNTNCIGSACMMWRYANGSGAGAKNKVGHCGLAGKPE